MDCPRHIIGEIEKSLRILKGSCGERHKCLQAVYEIEKQIEKARLVFEKEMNMNMNKCWMDCNGK